MVGRIGSDHRLDRLLGIGRAAEREEAEGAVLLDDRRLARRMIARAKPVQRGERVFVGCGRVEFTRRGQVPILRRHGRGGQDSGGDERSDPPRRVARVHFFLKSTLRRAGAVNVTVTLWRCSPRSGLRNTTSCVPMVTCRLPIGVSPTFSPSTQTSAHGTAFSAIVPFGNSILIGVTLPALTCTVRTAR